MFCSRLLGCVTLANTTVLSVTRPLGIVPSVANRFSSCKRFVATLTPEKITELLSQNEIHIDTKDTLIPTCIRWIECNQLEANNPIEDRIRISSVRFPDSEQPTLILGVFDGHGGGTTADLISRRLFNYIALSLHPQPDNLKISCNEQLSDIMVDLLNSPQPSDDSRLQALEIDMLSCYKHELSQSSNGTSLNYTDIASSIKKSFQRCDDDLSKEIQNTLLSSSKLDMQTLRHYMSAAVSGCCAIVMVIHRGFAYLASTGDCRAVLGVHDKKTNDREGQNGDSISQPSAPEIEHPKANSFRALELNDEHNCDNTNEVRRLTASHPKSEQNTMIKLNRLLGHLMPFRAFGDFNYKWPADVIKECGITRAFGPGVISSNYETPPYLIVEPDVRIINLHQLPTDEGQTIDASLLHGNQNKYLIMASDGLWELFESSRDVIEAIANHSINANLYGDERDYDTNCATYILRSALCNGPHQDISLDQEKLRRLHHIRLESTLTLPKSVVRNFRDDISIILLKLR